MRLTLSSTQDILGGAVCFDGTRIPVAAVSDFLGSGCTIDAVLSEYPTLQREQVSMIWLLRNALGIPDTGE